MTERYSLVQSQHKLKPSASDQQNETTNGYDGNCTMLLTADGLLKTDEQEVRGLV